MWSRISILIIGLSWSMMLVGCYTAQKAQRQALRHQSRYPEQMARNCVLWYPVKEYDSTRIEYREGEAIVSHDTLVFTDTVTNTVYKTIKEKVVVKDTIVRFYFKKMENTARITAYEQENERLKGVEATKNQEIKDLKSDKRKLYWVIGGLSSVICGYIGIKLLRRKIPLI